MAAKILFLLALLTIPFSIQAQKIKPSFTVEFKIDKLNYDFGEDIKPTIIIKNVSGKKDSLDDYEFFDTFGNNVYLLKGRDTIRCVKVLVTTTEATYKIFKPEEEYVSEYHVTGTCGNSKIGNSLHYTILDTGSYILKTSLSKKIGFDGINYVLQEYNSNVVRFHIIPPNEDERNAYLELSKIVSYTIEQFHDTVFMKSVADKIDEFVRKKIDTHSGDLAFKIAEYNTWRVNSYRNNFLLLSEYYLTRKPNGSGVERALYTIFRNCYDRTKNYDEGKAKINMLIEQNPGTKIETIGKKILSVKFDK